MDKRIIRTKRAIRSAFLDLRKEQPLEEIKVIDICALSVINKTTFYKYYTDIFDLNAAIENEVFTAFMEDFTEFHSLFINTSGFIQNLIRIHKPLQKDIRLDIHIAWQIMKRNVR